MMTASTTHLALPDRAAVADLFTLVGRVRRVDPEAAARLIVVGDLLAIYVCVLPAGSLTGPGPVLGLRTMRLADPAELDSGHLDVTVPLGALADRCSRLLGGEGERSGWSMPVPPTRANPSWAGITPPRQGWQPHGSVSAERLLTAARTGARLIAEGTPDGAGSAAVARLRALVWSRPLEQLADGGAPVVVDGDPARPGAATAVPSGIGFAADVLGFVRAGDAALPVHALGRWLRVSSPRGYLLARTAG